MAARSNDQEEEEIWGTWEELILACLVKRYGPHSWDAIASEIRSRFPSAHRLSPDECRSRYQLLRSRFGDPKLIGDDDDTSDIPWLDELRSLRVAELRQEVQRHDEFIGSLQQTVKKLKEERESGSRSDTKEERKESKEIVGVGISGDYSGRSCNESNNTERKEDPEKKIEEQVKANTNKVNTGSRSGSVNTNLNRNENESSSEMQSLFSRRRKRGGRGSGGDTSVALSVGKEREDAEFESQPLIALLERIQSSKDGLVFEKRLQSQESERYKSIIRRHIDLEIIRSRIETSKYSRFEFFRDLLLLCNNAIVFYPKNSAESISAVRLRNRINKEISIKLHKTSHSSLKTQKRQTPSPQVSSQPKPETEKPAKSVPLVACRKRSSVTEKPTKHIKKAQKEGAEKEEKQRVEEEEEQGAGKKSVKPRGPRTSKSRVKTGGGKPNPVANLKPEAARKERESGGKKNVGRPTKRGGKREREEKSTTSSPKKRGRR